MTLHGFRDKDTTVRLRDFSDKILANSQISSPSPTGVEKRYCKVVAGSGGSGPILAADLTSDPPELAFGTAIRMIVLADGSMEENAGSHTMDIWNTTDAEIEADKIVQVVREGRKWMVMPAAVAAEPTKRLRFQLTEPIQRDDVATPNSGFALADVIDPGNTDIELPAQITVYDPNKEFCFAVTGSIGWATSGLIHVADDPPTNPPVLLEEDNWVIESCTQLLNKISVTCSSPVSPWVGTPVGQTFNAIESQSYWPYVLEHEDEGSEIDPALVVNPHNITANPGKLWLERRELSADTQNIDTTIPYTDNLAEYQWHIVGCDKPTARWVQVRYTGNESWVMDSSGIDAYWEGFDPTMNTDIGDCIAPKYTDGYGTWCAVEDNTKGIAFLDDITGNYIVASTMSAYYGEGKKTSMVAVLMEGSHASDPLIAPDALDPDPCGKGIYKELKNVITFGSEDSGSSCKLEQTVPDPGFDLLETASDTTVMSGVYVDSNGDIQMETKTIKACYTDGSDIPFPLPTVDITVLNSVGCTPGGEFLENYTTYSVVGSEGATGSNNVDVSCIQDHSVDYEDVVYPEYPYIDYYDIIWPGSCDPCPVVGVGCCTAAAYPQGQGGITQADCLLETGYTSWTAGDCPTPDPTGCCAGGTADGTDTTQALCEAGGGVYGGDGTSCSEPVGCCTNTAYSSGDSGWTEANCQLSDGFVSWVEGDCPAPPCNCCDDTQMGAVTWAYPTDYSATNGSIGFTTTGSWVDVSECSWTIDGDVEGSSFGSVQSATLSLSYSGGTWTVSLPMPSPYGGTASGSLARTICESDEGLIELIIPVTGTHNGHDSQPGSFSGDVTIAVSPPDCPA